MQFRRKYDTGVIASKTEKSEIMFCTECGQKVKSSFAYCPYCGTRISTNQFQSSLLSSHAASHASIDDFESLCTAVETVLDAGEASVSILQRRMRIGFMRATHLIDEMEEMGILGPFNGCNPRKILVSKDDWEEYLSRPLASDLIVKDFND